MLSLQLIQKVLYKIAAELSEGKKNYLLTQKWLQKLSEEEQNQFIKWLEQTDPTPKGKYLEFLTKIFREADPEQRKRYLKEDSAQIKKDLTQFEQLKQQNKIPTAEKNPQSLEELYQTVEKYSEVKSRRQEEKEIKQQGVELILNHPPYKVYKVTSADACPLMAAGSKWCVSQISFAKKYLKDGPLYFITKDNQKHALFHYESAQFMNVFDRPLEKEEKWKLFKLLEPVTGKDIYSVGEKILLDYMKDHQIKERDPKAEQTILKQDFNDDFPKDLAILEYMIQTNMKNRWPVAEEVMATNKDKRTYYSWLLDYQKILGIKGRSIELEEKLLSEADPWLFPNYLKNRKIKKRIPKFEEKIETLVKSEKDVYKTIFPALNYMKQAEMKTDWPKLKTAILEKFPDKYVTYIKQINSKKPNLEFEKLFDQGKVSLEVFIEYKKQIGDMTPIPQIESKLKEGKIQNPTGSIDPNLLNPWSLINYFKLFKKRQPQIEQTIKLNPFLYFEYVTAVGVEQFSTEELGSIRDYPFELIPVREAIKEAIGITWAGEDIDIEKNWVQLIGEFYSQESIFISAQRICLRADDLTYKFMLPEVAEEINQKFKQSKKLKQVQFNLKEAATGLVCVPTPKELLAPNPFKTKAQTLLQKIYQKLIKGN